MKILAPSLVLTLLSIGSTAFAQETAATPDAAIQSASAAPSAPTALSAPVAQPIGTTPPAPVAPAVAVTPAEPAVAVTPAEPAAPPSEPLAMPIRPLLEHFAHQEALHRYGEGAMGLAGSGVLLGAGFAAAPHDSTWSTVLWISSGVVALGSIGRLFVPSELEGLERESAGLSEQQLRARWRELADAKRME
jgi:hypothetical protein